MECDDVVQHEILIGSLEELQSYCNAFEVKGGYGTDFRPVFAYVADLIKRRELTNLKGLIYFTDGHGIYPKSATPYITAFAFLEDEEFDDSNVPEWAMRVYL